MRSGSKVTQGQGPFLLKMKELQDEDTYIQIDGESIRVRNLMQVKISKTSAIIGSRINIMVNPE